MTEEWGTFANYRTPRLGARIDWILTSPSIEVKRAAINPTEYLAGAPSDHLSVHAVIEIGADS